MAVVFAIGCSDGNGFMPGGENGSHETVETIDAPLFVYEILAEQATDSSGIDILDLLSAPRVEQLLMNHIPEEVAVVQAHMAAAAQKPLAMAKTAKAALSAIWAKI